jgi:hypothetical protein
MIATAGTAMFVLASENSTKPLALVLFGHSARPDCGSSAMRLHFQAVQSQKQHMIGAFEKAQYAVTLVLATNICGGASRAGAWGAQLVDAYKPYLQPRNLALDNCISALDGRCLLSRVLALLEALQTGGRFDLVILSRPDLIWTSSHLLLQLVAKPHQITWPFRCAGVWALPQYRCVADVAVAVPGEWLQPFLDECMGALGCFPEAVGAHGLRRKFDNYANSHILKYPAPGWLTSIRIRDNNGHHCYRCAAALQKQEAQQLDELVGVGFAGADYRCFNITDFASPSAVISCRAQCVADSPRCKAWTLTDPAGAVRLEQPYDRAYTTSQWVNGEAQVRRWEQRFGVGVSPFCCLKNAVPAADVEPTMISGVTGVRSGLGGVKLGFADAGFFDVGKRGGNPFYDFTTSEALRALEHRKESSLLQKQDPVQRAAAMAVKGGVGEGQHRHPKLRAPSHPGLSAPSHFATTARSKNCVRLANFQRVDIEKEVSRLPQPASKALYFNHLSESFGYRSGRQQLSQRQNEKQEQNVTHTPLCLDAAGSETQLALPSCLLSTPYRWVLFFGDSLVREQAASFRRHALADRIGCQPWGNGSSVDTKDTAMSHVACGLEGRNGVVNSRVGRSDGAALCPSQARFESSTLSAPCNHRFESAYYPVRNAYWLPKAGKPSVYTKLAAHLRARSACPGIVVTGGNNAAGFLEGRKYADGKEKWMRDALSRLCGLLQASAHPETILVWGLPSAPQLSIMALEPPKPELQDFREGLSQLARFRSIEASVFAQGRRRNDMLLPVDAV